VRVTDEFMRAVEEDKDWWTKNVTDGQPTEKLSRRSQDFRIDLAVRRSGHAVRHDGESLAHVQDRSLKPGRAE